MKRSRGALMLIILPTETLFVGSDSADELLSKVEASLKNIIEAAVLRWSQLESGWGTEAPVGALDATVQERVRETLVEDYGMDPYGEFASWLSDEDRRDIQILINITIETLFEDVMPILDELNLSTFQLQTLKPLAWVGNSLVVDLVV